MRAACEPDLDLWRLVGRIVVHHEVDVWPLGDRGVDPLEEVEELGCPMALVAFPDHGAGGNVEQIGRASCRERVCQYVWILVVAETVKKKKQERRRMMNIR